MRHCVASYVGRVERGWSRVYRVLAPERCTLALRWNAVRAAWSIDQLRGVENRHVSGSTLEFVKEWLDHQEPFASTACG